MTFESCFNLAQKYASIRIYSICTTVALSYLISYSVALAPTPGCKSKAIKPLLKGAVSLIIESLPAHSFLEVELAPHYTTKGEKRALWLASKARSGFFSSSIFYVVRDP